MLTNVCTKANSTVSLKNGLKLDDFSFFCIFSLAGLRLLTFFRSLSGLGGLGSL